LYLGTKPKYKGDGTGVILRGVYPGSPAAQAGLEPGDKVVELGKQKVSNVEEYLKALEGLKAGKKTSIRIERNGKILDLRITPILR